SFQSDDREDATEMVMIGIDPHKGSHTAVALDDHELELGSLKVRTATRQTSQLLEWAAPFGLRIGAIESANGLVGPNDARSMAVAALRAPRMTGVRCEDHVTVLRLLAKRQMDLGRGRNKVCCRPHAHVSTRRSTERARR